MVGDEMLVLWMGRVKSWEARILNAGESGTRDFWNTDTCLYSSGGPYEVGTIERFILFGKMWGPSSTHQGAVSHESESE